MLAAALLDGELGPAQYAPERVIAADVQALMHKVHISPSEAFSQRFPDEMPADLRITLTDGTTFEASHHAYEGFHTEPAGWDAVEDKFIRLTRPFADADLREEITAIVRNLEHEQTATLTAALAQVSTTPTG